MTSNVQSLSTQEYIVIKGARQHNLKNIDVAIPRNQLIVITGVSGSGKSSLAYDTLYAEGQRRYVESLSSYARQFLGKIDKPKVESIKGISPSIAVEQKVNSSNPRSTVGTTTEIYDYLKLLYARIGKTYSPISHEEVKKHTVEDVLQAIYKLEEDTKVSIFTPIHLSSGRELTQQLNLLHQQGFSRVKANGSLLNIQDLLQSKQEITEELLLLIDRLIVKKQDEDSSNRIADSVETAFFEGKGECIVHIESNGKEETMCFSNLFEKDGITFEEPSPHFFSFNNPMGACKICEGFGSVIGIDKDLIVPNKNLSVYEEAVVCWKGEKMSQWKDNFILNSHHFDFPIHRPYCELSEEQKEVLWQGNKYVKGINQFFEHIETQTHKIQYRVMLSRYRGKTICPDCRGTRLRKDANYVIVGDKSISDLVLMQVSNLILFFKNLQLNEHDTTVAKRLLIEIKNRLQYLNDVGLGYLTLNRLSSSLSGGESQRINLAARLGSNLMGSLYILDEPSIGLHPRDTQRLIGVLRTLQQLGNTVIVVEHDEEIMNASDQIIDLGPGAGEHGGELVFQGRSTDTNKMNGSLTMEYLHKIKQIEVPATRRKWNDYIEIIGAQENNLKNINVKFPLHTLCVVAGVSGSGKSTLINHILYPTLKKLLGGYAERTGTFNNIGGSHSKIHEIELVDQKPIGKSSRSNPVTYVKAYDEIRNVFAKEQLSHVRGFKPSHFSFNVDGGRCEVCSGDGEITVEMQFMADVHLRCDACNGRRFKEEVLEIKYHGKSITDILDMTVNEAIDFFQSYNIKIKEKLLPLQQVGLGYVHLGQSSNTLSGGEAQRIKLASFLGNHKQGVHTLFLFDEPTTGLHFHDISKLLESFNALIKQGHSVIIIEHNPEIIKSADWLIELGPEGGEKGGYVIFEGTPEEIVNNKQSPTAPFVKEKLVMKSSAV